MLHGMPVACLLGYGYPALTSIADGVARVEGLPSVMASELLEFPQGLVGVALQIDEEDIGVVFLGEGLLHHHELGALQRALAFTDQDRVVSWLPLSHDMGMLAFLALPMQYGVELVASADERQRLLTPRHLPLQRLRVDRSQLADLLLLLLTLRAVRRTLR